MEITAEDVNVAYQKGWDDCCISFGITQEMRDAYELRTVGRTPEDEEALPVESPTTPLTTTTQ